MTLIYDKEANQHNSESFERTFGDKIKCKMDGYDCYIKDNHGVFTAFANKNGNTFAVNMDGIPTQCGACLLSTWWCDVWDYYDDENNEVQEGYTVLTKFCERIAKDFCGYSLMFATMNKRQSSFINLGDGWKVIDTFHNRRMGSEVHLLSYHVEA